MFAALRASAADIARRSVMGLVGAVLLIVSAGFFTSAAWYWLFLWGGAMLASLLIGLFYLLAGLVLLLIAREPSAPDPDLAGRDEPPLQKVLTAFFNGVEAGSRTRPSRRR